MVQLGKSGYTIGDDDNLSLEDRKTATFLIVDKDPEERQLLRMALVSLGFGNITDTSDHMSALEKLQKRPITHVLFQAKDTVMPAREFLIKALHLDEKLVAIPTSYEPTVDDVFSLLMHGAKGYLVKPFTPETVDEAIAMSTKGDKISDAILFAKDRNEALASLCLQNLDKLARCIRQSYQFETAKREIPQRKLTFLRAVRLARTFYEHDLTHLRSAMVETAIERGNGPAGKLGRTRKRLQKRKGEIMNRMAESERKKAAVEKIEAQKKAEARKAAGTRKKKGPRPAPAKRGGKKRA